MKGCEALLVLLFCLSGTEAEGHNGLVNERQSNGEPDLWEELMKLRDMVHKLGATVVLQSGTLSNTENRLAISEEEAKKQGVLITEMAAKLSTSESQVKDLQARLSTSESHVEVLQTRLSASESQVEGFETRMSTGESQVEDLKEESEAHLAMLSTIETRLTAAESQVQELWNKPKVGFSAGLRTIAGQVGPFGSLTTLVYEKVHSNIGNAYNPSTGIFSAPSKGVYLFTYAAVNLWSSEYFCISMYKNEQQLLRNCGYNTGGHEQISSGMIVEMEEGDRVYMRLQGGYRLYENPDTYNVFSGVLVNSM